MYGDFSRLTFAPEKRYSSVLIQQGRVGLDADANENTAILLHLMRMLTRDIIGPHGGPQDAGFAITATQSSSDATKLGDLEISYGHYYVEGLLAENPVDGSTASGVSYFNQPDAYLDPEIDRLPDSFPLLVYLKVWERHVTALEDPEIREIALGSHGPDTAGRSKVVWQVRVTDKRPDGTPIPAGFSQADAEALWPQWVAQWQPSPLGTMKAQARRPADATTDVCIVSPEARYRGPENQLYRVEIHQGDGTTQRTFKWSRDNGSVIFAIDDLSGAEVTLESLGRDVSLGLEVGDWVEIVDDAYAVRGRPEPLHQIVALDRLQRQVTLDSAPTSATGRDPNLHPFLRRWDQKNGGKNGVTLDTATDHAWLDLEDGVQVQFQGDGPYRSGDYWLIPARTEIGDVLWPGTPGNRTAKQPDGVPYYFAPLGLVTGAKTVTPLRHLFSPLP